MDIAAQKVMMFRAQELPEECVRRAQVVIVSEGEWFSIAPDPFRAHGNLQYVPVPKVTCPVIDLRGVPEVNDERVGEVLRACTVNHAGVINMAGLVTGLCALGGRLVDDKKTVNSDQLAVVRRDLTPNPSPKGEGSRTRRSVSHVYASK